MPGLVLRLGPAGILPYITVTAPRLKLCYKWTRVNKTALNLCTSCGPSQGLQLFLFLRVQNKTELHKLFYISTRNEVVPLRTIIQEVTPYLSSSFRMEACGLLLLCQVLKWLVSLSACLPPPPLSFSLSLSPAFAGLNRVISDGKFLCLIHEL